MSADAKWPWSVLGFDKMPAEPADIRRAYARALKKIDQSRDIEGFTALRQAYEYALALREGRDARKAAKAERKAAAEAPVPEPALADIPMTEPPAPTVVPDPAVAQQRAAEAQAQADCAALVGLVSRPNLVIGLQERLTQALASPLLDDALFHGRIRRAIVMALRDARRPRADGKGSTIPHDITPALVEQMNQRFRWIDDLAAFRGDFGHDTELLALLVDRCALARPLNEKADEPAGPRVERKPAKARETLWLSLTRLLFWAILVSTVSLALFYGSSIQAAFLIGGGSVFGGLLVGVLTILVNGLWRNHFHRNVSILLTFLTWPTAVGLLAQLWDTGRWADVMLGLFGPILLVLTAASWHPRSGIALELWLSDARAKLPWRRSG